MNIKKITSIVALSCVTLSLSAQTEGVSIAPTVTPPAPSAMLDVSATDKGVLIPRLLESQKNAIQSPEESLLIYQTNGAKGFYYWDDANTTWAMLGGGGGLWTQGTGDDIYRNVNEGNVGIGLNSPTEPLQVYRQATSSNSLSAPPSPFTSYLNFPYLSLNHAETAIRAEFKGVTNPSLVQSVSGIIATGYNGQLTTGVTGIGIATQSTAMGFGGNFIAMDENGASGSSSLVGVNSYAYSHGQSSATVGVLAYGIGGNVNIGIEAHGNGNSGSIANYGIKASATGGLSNYAGFFSGNVTVTGVFTNPSDFKLKKDIKNLTDGLNVIEKLSPKTFNYRTEEFPQLGLPDKNSCGLIAQDVEKVLPNLITTEISPKEIDKDGKTIAESVTFKSVNYMELIPILIQAVKEQQAIIEAQEVRIKALER